MTVMMQTSFVPGWAITVPLLICVGLLIWLLLAPSETIEGHVSEALDYDEPDWDDEPGEPAFSTEAPVLDNYEPTADELREHVIGLWNECGGWIPGAAYADLAYVLGVDPERMLEARRGR